MYTFAASIAEVGLLSKPDRTFFSNGYLDGFSLHESLTIVDLAEYICRGDSFAAVFNGRPSRESFVSGQVLAVDLDGGPLSWYGALTSHPFVQAYACLVYPTLSHTPELPRHRVVFVLDAAIRTAQGYEDAARTVTALFAGADQACTNAGRNFLGNGRIRPERLDVWYQEQVLPLRDLRIIYTQQRAAAKRHQPPTPTRPQGLAPRDGDAPDFHEVRERLERLDPYAIGYDEWVKLGAAVAHVYGDMAFHWFKQWSDRPGEEPLTERKWKSLATAHPNAAGVGTIIYYMQRVAA